MKSGDIARQRERLQAFILRHQLPVMLTLSLLIAVSMTILSVGLYIQSGAQELDLSRPGYESVRNNVERDNNEKPAFAPNGTLSDQDINEFKDQFREQRQTLDSLDDFSEDVLSDSSLRLFQ